MKNLLSLSVIILLASSTYGQLSWEAGFSTGIMNSGTDVGTRKGSNLNPGFYDWSMSQLSLGIYGETTFKGVVGARIEMTYGSVAANDAYSNSKYVRSRNLNFKSHIYEAALITSLYPLKLINKNNSLPVQPYIMGGVGIFSYYPTAWCNGEWISLRPLHTEGQNSKLFPDRKEYSLTSISIPVGVGAKYELSPKVNLKMEVLYRYTNTDYLDDVSTTYVDPAIIRSCVETDLKDHAEMVATMYKEINKTQDRTGRNRGNAENNDRFFSINFKLGYSFGK